MPYTIEWDRERGIIRKLYSDVVTAEDWVTSWNDILELGEGKAFKSARIMVNDYSQAVLEASSEEASDPVEKAYRIKSINGQLVVITITDNPLVYGYCRMIQQMSEDILDFHLVRSKEEADELIESIIKG